MKYNLIRILVGYITLLILIVLRTYCRYVITLERLQFPSLKQLLTKRLTTMFYANFSKLYLHLLNMSNILKSCCQLKKIIVAS